MFPPFTQIIAFLEEISSSEEVLRERQVKAEAEYKRHLDEISEEMKKTKEDKSSMLNELFFSFFVELDQLYGVDVRKMFYENPEVNDTIRSRVLECGISCHILDNLKVFN